MTPGDPGKPQSQSPPTAASAAPPDIHTPGAARRPLVFWLASHSLLALPQAAAPIAFALLTLPLTGSANSGAAMVMAMTLAQVADAVPIARAGSCFTASTFVRLLVAYRSACLLLIAGLAVVDAGADNINERCGLPCR